VVGAPALRCARCGRRGRFVRLATLARYRGRLTRTPLVTIEPVIGIPRAPWRVEDRGGLGDFRAVRGLRSREPGR
jgi:hypothetical protein